MIVFPDNGGCRLVSPGVRSWSLAPALTPGHLPGLVSISDQPPPAQRADMIPGNKVRVSDS